MAAYNDTSYFTHHNKNNDWHLQFRLTDKNNENNKFVGFIRKFSDRFIVDDRQLTADPFTDGQPTIVIPNSRDS